VVRNRTAPAARAAADSKGRHGDGDERRGTPGEEPAEADRREAEDAKGAQRDPGGRHGDPGRAQ
jgi:hypothetical protein